MNPQQEALWKRLPPPPEGCQWTLEFGAVTERNPDGGERTFEKVYIALLNSRGRTMRRGTIDVGMYGHKAAVEWATHVLEGTW